MLGKHAIGHLLERVDIATWFENGALMAGDRPYSLVSLLAGSGNDYYVHPTTGVLHWKKSTGPNHLNSKKARAQRKRAKRSKRNRSLSN